MSETLILIPSRLSAKRLPGKPLLKINGLSLINHVYKKAIASNIGDAYVVTGDIKIYKDVVNNGGKCILTKQKHHTGTDRIFEGLKQLKKKKFSYILNLQGDEPLINLEDIKRLNKIVVKRKIKFGTLACKFNNKTYLRNKNIVKVETNKKLSINIPCLASNFFRIKKRNNNLNIYHHIGVYIYKKKTLKTLVSMNQTINEKKLKLEQLRALENNIPISVILAKKQPIGVDTLKEFNKVKKLLETKI